MILSQPTIEASLADPAVAAVRKPAWLKRPIPAAGKKWRIERRLADHGLKTICEEAGCPNRAECFGRGTATLLIMGERCSRGCAFCGVTHASALPLDPQEPQRVCAAVKQMGISYVVITSVTRDDLPDGGAGHIAETVTTIRSELPAIGIELLVPDFNGDTGALDIVLAAQPTVLNHNIETVPRLYPLVRPLARFERSLGVLRHAAQSGAGCVVKSGIMVGLGEREDEVVAALHALQGAGCSIVTIGQYLQPSRDRIPVRRFATTEEFKRYQTVGKECGLTEVIAGPFVRSSYRAEHILQMIDIKPDGVTHSAKEL